MSCFEVKNKQLGMNAGTASGRLLKDILFSFVLSSGGVCFRCGKPMTRETFSVDHKVPFLHSDDPVGLFFDLTNIAYSHRVCNIVAARRPNKIYENDKVRRRANFKDYYGRNTEAVLKRKRDCYRNKKSELRVGQ